MSDTMKRVIRIVSIVAAIGLLVFSGIRMWTLYESYEQGLADAKEAKASLESDLSRQRQQLAEVDAEVDERNSDIHSVRTVGSDIAKLQNNWDSETSPEELSTYFQDDDCYQWYSDKKNNESWTCMNDYDFEGDSTVVIWLCTGSSLTDISAYATAEYSAETGKMSNLKVGMAEQDEEETVTEETTEETSESETTVITDSTTSDEDEEEYTSTTIASDHDGPVTETIGDSEETESEETESEETVTSSDVETEETGGDET